jgi:ABC-type polysaccharide/polyol phosphate transport system ATPase subunit
MAKKKKTKETKKVKDIKPKTEEIKVEETKVEEPKKEIAVTVKNLHITYRGLKKTSIRASWKNFGHRVELFHALKGVSFDVEEGKILGIIGKNGSGKSTMLRAIAGIFSPDKGKIDLHGRTISLLSIGVGFNKKLTGKENIYLSGMLLGFSEEQIKEKEKEIIQFADIGDFIHRPVKTYSSGMYSKLAFAITAILETDIMLIDEVLSVGDAKFKEKSYNKMKELISDDKRTVIIVSHSLDTILDLCDEVLWLNDGEVIEIGKPDEVVPRYEAFMAK